ncbi:MAG: hypothetical protein EXS36_19400 [Pedosphaera sp.]|nr:hypothetical protein [Pedosphaera sp.]
MKEFPIDVAWRNLLLEGTPRSLSPLAGRLTCCEHGPMAPAMGYSLALLRSFAPNITLVLADVKSWQIAGTASWERPQDRDAPHPDSAIDSLAMAEGTS